MNKHFPKKLTGVFVGKGRWKLIRPFIYVSEIGGVIEAPINFISDGASIFKVAQIIIGGPWEGKYAKAAVIHDWGYHTQKLSRKKVDLIFLEAMKILNVPQWKCRVMYRFVRAFGWIPWRNKAYRKEIKKA